MPISAPLALVEKAQGGADDVAGAAISAGGNLCINQGFTFWHQGDGAGCADGHGRGEVSQTAVVSIMDTGDHPDLCSVIDGCRSGQRLDLPIS